MKRLLVFILLLTLSSCTKKYHDKSSNYPSGTSVDVAVKYIDNTPVDPLEEMKEFEFVDDTPDIKIYSVKFYCN